MQALVLSSAVAFCTALTSKIFPKYRNIYHVKCVERSHSQNLENGNIVVGHSADAKHDSDTYDDCDVTWYNEKCHGVILSTEKEPISWFSPLEDEMQIDFREFRGCKSCGFTENRHYNLSIPFKIPVMFNP